MKKSLSIVLLGILSFNWCGYHLLIFYLQEAASTKLESQLDHGDYDESQLVSVKIPVSYLPYYNNSGSYERVDGQIEIGGVSYQYVKRRIYKDSLEMLCIASHEMMKIQSAKDEFFQFVNDLHHSAQNRNHSSALQKNMAADYESAIEQFKIDEFCSKTLFALHYIIHISRAYLQLPEQPPNEFYEAIV